MNLEPTLLDFHSEHDVNFAIANAFIFAFNIDRSKFLLDMLVWNAEQEVNKDLFEKSAPWYKGYAEITPGVFKRVEESPSDNPMQDEISYFTRNKDIVEYVPKSLINPSEASTGLTYKLIDDRVALLALSWWTMFISTKDGRRMVYYPYTSQLLDSINLHKYPSRDAWIRDNKILNHYAKKGINSEKIPNLLAAEHALDFMYLDMKSLLETEGFKFVLWLYNYMKSNNFLVPYDYRLEYVKSTNDTVVYRDGRILNINNPADFAKTGEQARVSSQQTVNQKDIHSATGLSQSGFMRNRNSCGILINTPENLDELNFSNDKLFDRLRKNSKDAIFDLINKESVKWNADLAFKAIDSDYVLRYISMNKIGISGFKYVIVTSSLDKQGKIFAVTVSDDYEMGIGCRLIGILPTNARNRIEREAIHTFNMMLRARLRPEKQIASEMQRKTEEEYGVDTIGINRSNIHVVENQESWKIGKISVETEQIRRSR